MQYFKWSLNDNGNDKMLGSCPFKGNCWINIFEMRENDLIQCYISLHIHTTRSSLALKRQSV